MEDRRRYYSTSEEERWKRAVQCAIEYDTLRRQAMVEVGLQVVSSRESITQFDEANYSEDVAKIAEEYMNIEEDKWNILTRRTIETEINFETLRKQMMIEAGLEYKYCCNNGSTHGY